LTQEGGTDGDLDPVVGALAELDGAEFHALSDAKYWASQIAPDLPARNVGAYEHELHRRRGLDFPLDPSEAARGSTGADGFDQLRRRDRDSAWVKR